MKLQKILSNFQKLHPKEIDLSLDRIQNLCKKLGNPQDKIKAISVVGTNGKNSTINGMFSILKEANFNCNVYTSPHILKINERFIFNNKELNDYFQKLGESIAKESHRPKLKWTFTLIDDPTFNAFATPGGYVYMYRGMLNYFNSEAEFAGVIGHEIAHITARHAVRGMSTAQVSGLLLGLLQANVPGGQLTGNAFNLVNMVINRGYSRKFELEADQLGEEYLDRLDYDPSAMSAFLKTLKYSDELETKIAKIEDREPNIGYHGIFSTHPDHHD